MEKKIADTMSRAPIFVKERTLTREIVDAARRWFSNPLLIEILDQQSRMNYSIYQSFVDLETRVQLDKNFKDVNYEKFVEFAAQTFGIEYTVS